MINSGEGLEEIICFRKWHLFILFQFFHFYLVSSSTGLIFGKFYWILVKFFGDGKKSILKESNITSFVTHLRCGDYFSTPLCIWLLFRPSQEKLARTVHSDVASLSIKVKPHWHTFQCNVVFSYWKESWFSCWHEHYWKKNRKKEKWKALCNLFL